MFHPCRCVQFFSQAGCSHHIRCALAFYASSSIVLSMSALVLRYLSHSFFFWKSRSNNLCCAVRKVKYSGHWQWYDALYKACICTHVIYSAHNANGSSCSQCTLAVALLSIRGSCTLWIPLSYLSGYNQLTTKICHAELCLCCWSRCRCSCICC